MNPQYWTQATDALAASDAVLGNLIAQFDGLAVGSRGDALRRWPGQSSGSSFR
jgi:hypothetical protein